MNCLLACLNLFIYSLAHSCLGSAQVSPLDVAEATPLANLWVVVMLAHHIDVLHGVAQAKFVDSFAPHYVHVDLDHWHLRNQLFCVALVRNSRMLELGFPTS